MNKLKLLLLSAFAGTLIVSCQKGTTGPAGAAGVTGATGAAGAAGTDSILYSAPIRLVMNPVLDTANDWYGFVDSVGAPALTQDVISQDIVLGYVYVPFGGTGDSAWVSVDNNTNDGVEMFPQVGLFVVESFWTDFVTANNNGDLTGIQFKYFIIPPSLLSSISQLTTQPPVTPTALKRMSYTKAMTTLALHPSEAGNIRTAATIR
jgi:hypothetical protein